MAVFAGQTVDEATEAKPGETALNEVGAGKLEPSEAELNELAQGKSAKDKLTQDEPAQDKSARDKLAQTEPGQDKPNQGEHSQNNPIQDRPTQNTRTPLALHACCGPCSLEPVKHLREEGFEPVIFWSNANIQPAAEHDLRLRTLLAWAEKEQVKVVLCEQGAGSGITSTKTLDEAREQWEHVVAPHGFDREARCRACYALRLAQSCKAAAELGFTFTSTTLAVSPYQLFDTCTDELNAIAQAQGLTPIVRDWREFYPEATRESRSLGMYRQNYCGCRFSAAEAAIERHERRDERKRAKQNKGSI